jgi:hypothetical protein
MDGHDQLNRAGFGTYGIRDKWGGKFLHYRVLPSNRYAGFPCYGRSTRTNVMDRMTPLAMSTAPRPPVAPPSHAASQPAHDRHQVVSSPAPARYHAP